MKKITWLLSLIVLLIIPLISADVIAPLSIKTLPIIPLIIIFEAIAFWILTNKLFNIKIGFWKLILIIGFANIISSFIGTIFETVFGMYVINKIKINLNTLLISFILSIIIELIVISLCFIKRIKNKEINILKLALTTTIANFISYFLIFLMILNKLNAPKLITPF